MTSSSTTPSASASRPKRSTSLPARHLRHRLRFPRPYPQMAQGVFPPFLCPAVQTLLPARRPQSGQCVSLASRRLAHALRCLRRRVDGSHRPHQALTTIATTEAAFASSLPGSWRRRLRTLPISAEGRHQSSSVSAARASSSSLSSYLGRSTTSWSTRATTSITPMNAKHMPRPTFSARPPSS